MFVSLHSSCELPFSPCTFPAGCPGAPRLPLHHQLPEGGTHHPHTHLHYLLPVCCTTPGTDMFVHHFYNIVRVSLRSWGIPKYWYLRFNYNIQILYKTHCSLNLAMLSSGHDPPLPGRLDGPLDVGSGHGPWQLFHPVPDRAGWPAGDWLPSPVLPLALVHRGQRH